MNSQIEPKTYYAVEQGAKKGPFTISILETMREQGALTRTSLVWTDGMEDWAPAAQVIPEIFPADPPAVSSAKSDSPARPIAAAPALLTIAHPKWRFLGGVIDFCVLYLPMQFVIIPTAAATLGAGFFLELIFPCVYAAVLMSTQWQGTVGMKLLGLKAVDYSGRKLSPGKCWGRGAASIVSSLVFGIGYLLLFFTPRRQTLHDLMAGTLVVRAEAK